MQEKVTWHQFGHVSIPTRKRFCGCIPYFRQSDPNLWLPKGNKLPNRTRSIVRLTQLVTSRYRYLYLDSDNLYSILVIEYNQSAPRRGQDPIERVERHTEDNAERHQPGMNEILQRGTNLEWPKVIFSFRSEMGTRNTHTPPCYRGPMRPHPI